MLNTVLRLMIISTLMIVAGPAHSDPANSGSALQLYYCQQADEVTDEQVGEMASAWLKAAKGMKEGAQLEGYLRFPIAANVGEHDFVFVLMAPSFAAWGAFTDAYEGSPAQDLDEKLSGFADCTRSAIWESFKVK